MSAAAPYVPVPPPGQDELPCDDGQPMETPRHRQQMNLLIESLRLALADRRDVFIGGNMFVYYSQLQTKQNHFRGPDFFVVLDAGERMRKSWVVWEEDGKMPNVVIELLSETTEAEDRGTKKEIYGRVLRVGEYYLYDPLDGRLEGYELMPTGAYRPLEPDEEGALPCRQLGLRLAVRPGSYQGEGGMWLRWLDAQGRVLPTGEEQARAAQEQARAAQEQARALQERLARYEERFGKLE